LTREEDLAHPADGEATNHLVFSEDAFSDSDHAAARLRTSLARTRRIGVRLAARAGVPAADNEALAVVDPIVTVTRTTEEAGDVVERAGR
jgi:hypothetical protein